MKSSILKCLIFFTLTIYPTTFQLNAKNNIPKDSLIAYYPFNENFNDQSENNYTVNVNGVVLTGEKNKACFFDGYNDYIEIPGIESLSNIKQLTVSCWIKPFNSNTWDSWISKANNNNRTSQWRFGFDAGPDHPIQMTIYNNDWNGYKTNLKLELKKWYHVVLSIDNISHKAIIYVNNKIIKSFDISELISSDGALLIGYQKDDRVFYNGLIDEVIIYSRLLSDAEINDLYNDFKNSEKAELNEQIFPVLKGEYLGQKPPADTPVVFAPGIISSNLLEHSAAIFTPDGKEVFWSVNVPPRSENEKWDHYVMTSKCIEDIWTLPVKSSFEGIPIFSQSKEGFNFDLSKFTYKDDEKITCYYNKIDGQWSELICFDLVKNYPKLKFDFNNSVANNGTLYFVAFYEGPLNDYGIYRSELVNGEYAKPEPLPARINMGNNILNWTPFIAPDESYLLFSSNRDCKNHDVGDLFISFRNSDGSWTEPANLGEPVNTNRQERFPYITPDGKYLFFTRWTPNHNQDIYWVSAKVIDKFKEKYLEK